MTKSLAVFVVAAGAAAAHSQIDPARVVAIVGGQEIKGAEFYRRMEFLPDVGKVVNGEFISSTPAFWTLERLITEKLILAVAKERGVTPTATELQGEMNLRLGTDNKVLEAWLASGQTRAELEQQVFIQLCQFKIATAGITVTDQEVEKFYRDYPSMFTSPKRYKLRVISVGDDAKKAQVDFQLQGGKTFAEVARAMSEDVTAVDGGYFGVMDATRLSEPMRKALEGVKVGATTTWIAVSGQSVKFLVEEITAPVVQPLDADLKRSIRRRLMLDKGKVKNDVSKMMSEMRKKTAIDIKSKDLASEYERIMRKFEPPTTIKPNP